MGRAVSLQVDEALFEKGSTVNCIYVVRKGRVACVGDDSFVVQSGEWINDEDLFVNRGHQYKTVCEEPASLIAISVDTFVSIIDKSEKMLDFVKSYQPIYVEALQSERRDHPAKSFD